MLPFRMVDATYPRPPVHHRKLRPAGDDSASARHAYPIPAGKQVGPNSALGSPCPSAPKNSNNSLTPFTATDPKKHVLSPIIATLPKTPLRKPFICHTSEIPPVVSSLELPPTTRYLPSVIPSLFILLRTLLPRTKCYLFCFQAIAHSLQKKTRGGGVLPTLKRQTFKRVNVPPARPIAAERPWCNNERRHENSSRSGETTPLPPVSKMIGRTSGTARSWSPTQVVPGYNVLTQRAF
jgi:hypothetical protein